MLKAKEVSQPGGLTTGFVMLACGLAVLCVFQVLIRLVPLAITAAGVFLSEQGHVLAMQLRHLCAEDVSHPGILACAEFTLLGGVLFLIAISYEVEHVGALLFRLGLYGVAQVTTGILMSAAILKLVFQSMDSNVTLMVWAALLNVALFVLPLMSYASVLDTAHDKGWTLAGLTTHLSFMPGVLFLLVDYTATSLALLAGMWTMAYLLFKISKAKPQC